VKAIPKTLATGTNNSSRQVSKDIWNAGHNVYGLTRAEIQALSPATGQIVHVNESGRAGLFEFDASDLSTEVAADTRQGVYLPPTSDATGASGAWVRSEFSNGSALNLKWFGATGDGTTDDSAAMTGALALQEYEASVGTTGGRELFCPLGTYNFGTTTFEIYRTRRIRGETVGDASQAATVFQWDAGCHGFIFQRSDTSGLKGKGATGKSGSDGSIVEGIRFKGGFPTSLTEGDWHGVVMRARVTMRDCYVQDFEGEGVRIAATSGAAADVEPPHGNANNWLLDKCRIDRCRTGLYIDGSDVNQGCSINLQLSENRQHGIADFSLLGNTHINPLTQTNGRTSYNDGVDIPCSLCSDGTYRYYVQPGQAAGASTNAPSGAQTDNTWWAYVADGASTANGLPLWFSGISVREGYPYYTDNSNCRSLFLNPYRESGGGDQAKTIFAQRTMALGGINSYGGTYKPNLYTEGGNLLSQASFKTYAYDGSDDTFWASLGESGATTVLSFLDPAGTTNWRLRCVSGDVLFDYGNSGVGGFRITGAGTAQQFGTGAAYGNRAFYARYLMVGDTDANARRMTNGTAAPASGAHGVGEIVWNRTPSSGNPMGWICTVAGTPGTWAALANVA
jgi:hypothetical protein